MQPSTVKHVAMNFILTLFASLTLAGCVTHSVPDTSVLVGMSGQQATEALRARGLDNFWLIVPPLAATKPAYLYAGHRDLAGWPCPPRQRVAVHF